MHPTCSALRVPAALGSVLQGPWDSLAKVLKDRLPPRKGKDQGQAILGNCSLTPYAASPSRDRNKAWVSGGSFLSQDFVLSVPLQSLLRL
jgi:hypothetical protein